MIVNNVLILFQDDKANILYENIQSHDFASIAEMKKENLTVDDYGYLDEVTVVLVSRKILSDISYYLKDLPDDLLKYKSAIDKDTNTLLKDSCFIVTDKKKYLLIMTAGFSYPRFKGFIDKETIQAIKKIVKK